MFWSSGAPPVEVMTIAKSITNTSTTMPAPRVVSLVPEENMSASTN